MYYTMTAKFFMYYLNNLTYYLESVAELIKVSSSIVHQNAEAYS